MFQAVVTCKTCPRKRLASQRAPFVPCHSFRSFHPDVESDYFPEQHSFRSGAKAQNIPLLFPLKSHKAQNTRKPWLSMAVLLGVADTPRCLPDLVWMSPPE